MKTLKILLTVATLSLVLIAGALYATAGDDYPPLQDGDVIFQTSLSAQSGAILVASASLYTHTGIIKKVGNSYVVIESRAAVTETPLQDWVKQGLFRRVAIYRDPQLTAEQKSQIISAAQTYYGQPYDIFFALDNGAIYCSELPYLAYQRAGINIGQLQKISELNFDNILVKKLIKQRWRRYDACTSKNYTFEQCYAYILQQPLITPDSIANDPKFKKIYSNYFF